MKLFEIVRRCKYCGSDMTRTTSSESYSQNPFCRGCLHERLEKASKERGPGHWDWESNKDYIEWIPDKPKGEP